MNGTNLIMWTFKSRGSFLAEERWRVKEKTWEMIYEKDLICSCQLWRQRVQGSRNAMDRRQLCRKWGPHSSCLMEPNSANSSHGSRNTFFLKVFRKEHSPVDTLIQLWATLSRDLAKPIWWLTYRNNVITNMCYLSH